MTVVATGRGAFAASAAVAVGVDVVSVTRIAALARRRPRFLERVFTEQERRDCEERFDRLAARWAAKEAVRKLAGSRGERPLPSFASIEVRGGGAGPTRIAIAGRLAPIAVSLSHDGDLAVAVVASADDPLAPHGPLAVSPPPRLRLAPRPATAHKGTFGTVVVLAGARGFTGAAYLAATGAARGGAGLVRLCVAEDLYPILASRCAEVMAFPLPDHGLGVVGPEAVDRLLADHLPHADALVVGCGLGRAAVTEAALARLLERLTCPTVVDADGLNIAAARRLPLAVAGQPVVVTPHPAEMARLVGVETASVQADRVGVARRFSADQGVIVVLKGSRTVVAAPDGRLHVDEHEVVALATGGTGDVLAGLCGALLAQGLDPFDAAVAAVTIHAEAGALVEAVRGRAGATASDLLEALPAAQERLRRVLEAAGGSSESGERAT